MAKLKTSIVFTGDIGFDKYMDRKWEDPELLSERVLDYLHGADHVCANVEGALIKASDEKGLGVLFHSMDPKAATVLEKMQADIWSLGNNHAMDAGKAGLDSTIQIAAQLGSKTLGAGSNINEASAPIYLDEAGGIGLLCVSYMTGCVPATETEPGIFRWDEMERIASRIAEIKSKCRWCIVISHGGEEFSAMPLPYTRNRYLKYLEMGADAVVGHHPHVPENYELLDNGKIIFYSLGNFIFDTDYQRAHPYTDMGLLVKLTFTVDKLGFEAVGTLVDRRTQRISLAPLPDIFTNIPAAEYELLSPLSAKAFLLEDRRIMCYLEPNKYVDCEPEVWEAYYKQTSSYYSKDAHMDYDVILPLSAAADSGKWQQSKLEAVKNYILHQFD